MSSNARPAIRVADLSKCYHIYENPTRRLQQFLFPQLDRMLRRDPRIFYKEFWALKEISFEINKGETVGIVGRNGAGKSTLLQILTGTLAPTSGSVEIHGRLAALLELGSGFNPEFSGRENVYLNAAILGLSRPEIENKIDNILAFADIGDFIDQPVKTYSSGMFVRLAFAIQANIDPEILIIDEALAVGDAYFVHKCMRRFKELQDVGVTLLFVSHDANAVRNLCSRSAWLADGRLRMLGPSSSVIDGYLANLFNRQEVAPCSTTREQEDLAITDQKISPTAEYLIPNIDRRLGDQKCSIVGVCLYDSAMKKIESIRNDSRITLRISFKNLSLDEHAKLILGYVFRNAKGQEIASTNSSIEDFKVESIPVESVGTIKMEVQLPILHPGNYSFSPTLAYFAANNEIILADRLENAIAFEVWSDTEVHVLMRFPTSFSSEI